MQNDYRESFDALDKGDRQGILAEPLGEIVRMVEQNLLEKFKQTKIMQQRRRLQAGKLSWAGSTHIRVRTP